MPKKLTYEYVKNYFEEQRCKLLEKEYINNYTKMKYKCNCGGVSKISFANFQKGHRCMECGTEKRSKKQRLTYSHVKQHFKNNGCELLEKEYKNAQIPLKYKCKCGNLNKISFASFYMGRRCRECGIKKNSGKNCHLWNPNLTDEERNAKRKSIEYYKWINIIYKKDDYTCQKCKKRKEKNNKNLKLNAHHFINYSENKELRFDKNNGITLCNKCHTKFHKTYGYKSNNRYQLKEFLKPIKLNYLLNNFCKL